MQPSGGALYAETDAAGTVLREYITLGGATIAIVDAGGVNYVHNDYLATPQVMTDGAAAVVWDASYRPFGEATIAGAAANQQRFPGQTADAETGYHDNWYRTYDPSLGRYLQSDPIGLVAGLNTYAYANGNPVMYADPTGELAFVPVIVIGFGVGASTDFLFQMAFNLGSQYIRSGYRWQCIDAGAAFDAVDWGDVLISGGLGAVGAGVGGLTMIKRVGKEFSHWLPDRYFRPRSLSGKSINPYYKRWLDNRLGQWFRNSRLNGNFVSPITHWKTDGFRKLSKALVEDLERYGLLIQQVFRLPGWLTGSVAGSGAGVAADIANDGE